MPTSTSISFFLSPFEGSIYITSPDKSIVMSVTKLIGAKPGAISDGGAAEVVTLTS
jgi:hypothetical protein